MSEGVKEYNVYIRVVITDELLVEAKNCDEAAEIGEEIYIETLRPDAMDVIRGCISVEVEEAI